MRVQVLSKLFCLSNVHMGSQSNLLGDETPAVAIGMGIAIGTQWQGAGANRLLKDHLCSKRLLNVPAWKAEAAAACDVLYAFCPCFWDRHLDLDLHNTTANPAVWQAI